MRLASRERSSRVARDRVRRSGEAGYASRRRHGARMVVDHVWCCARPRSRDAHTRMALTLAEGHGRRNRLRVREHNQIGTVGSAGVLGRSKSFDPMTPREPNHDEVIRTAVATPGTGLFTGRFLGFLWRTRTRGLEGEPERTGAGSRVTRELPLHGETGHRCGVGVEPKWVAHRFDTDRIRRRLDMTREKAFLCKRHTLAVTDDDMVE